jgi:hypothetical protein
MCWPGRWREFLLAQPQTKILNSNREKMAAQFRWSKLHSSTSGSMKVCIPLNPVAATQAVESYNRGKYRGRLNIDIDRDADHRFHDGLAKDTPTLIEQLRFVGEDYGGAQRRFLPHCIRDEAAMIAVKIAPVLSRFAAVVNMTAPLIERVPDQDLEFLFEPFVATKRWGVWASKTLHFLRPASFPVLDSNVAKALGAPSGSSVRHYRQFCVLFRSAMSESTAAIEAAKSVDGGISRSDVKLLDKILYELGRL